MRFRIFFDDETQFPVEVECFDIQVTGSRRLKVLQDPTHSVEMLYCSDIKRIADDHNRTVFDVSSQ